MKLRRSSRVNDNVPFRSCVSIFSLLLLCGVGSLFPRVLPAQSPAPRGKTIASSNPLESPVLEKKVTELLQKMTLEEKIGQLVQYSAGQATGPTSGRTDDKDMIRKGQVGSLFNVTGSRETNALQHIAVENSRLHIPLIFGLDVIHGFRTTFPIPLGLAATWEPELVEKAARVAAQESSSAGVRWAFSPMVDIARDSRWGRISEGAGEDPYLGAAAARKAFLAGVDMDMVSNLYHRNMMQLVQSGQVPQAEIDEAVRRILRVKYAMGLFDHPYTDEGKESSAMLRPESVALAKNAGTRSLVLLRNEAVSGSPILPLAAKVSSIALIGPLADDAGNIIGSWGALGRGEDAVTLRHALSQKLGDSIVRYAKGTNILDGFDNDIAAAVQAAQNSDVVLLALGEDAPTMTGEAASRAWIGLPGRQQELLEKVAAAGKPVVLVLFSGRPLTLPWAFEHVPAVIAAWFPGVQAGNALD